LKKAILFVMHSLQAQFVPSGDRVARGILNSTRLTVGAGQLVSAGRLRLERNGTGGDGLWGGELAASGWGLLPIDYG